MSPFLAVNKNDRSHLGREHQRRPLGEIAFERAIIPQHEPLNLDENKTNVAVR